MDVFDSLLADHPSLSRLPKPAPFWLPRADAVAPPWKGKEGGSEQPLQQMHWQLRGAQHYASSPSPSPPSSPTCTPCLPPSILRLQIRPVDVPLS